MGRPMEAPPASTPPSSASASPPSAPDPEARRRRVVIALSALGALAVMVGVVLVARAGVAKERDDHHELSEAAARALAGGGTKDDMPEGCTPDFDHPPRLVLSVPPDGIDFGAVHQGDSPVKEVEFHNGGTGLLCLRGEPVTGCGCVKASWVGDQRKYQPGESGKIRIQIVTGNKEGKHPKTVSLYTNDPDHPTSTFRVSVDISLGLLVSTPAVTFGQVAKGHEVSTVVRLKSPREDKDWTITSVALGPRAGRPEPPVATFTTSEVDDPRFRILDLKVTLPGTLDYGIYDYPIEIATTHPDRPKIELFAAVEVVAPVKAYPSRAAIGFVPPGRPARVRILPGQTGISFHVTGVHVDDPKGRPETPGGPAFTATFGESPVATTGPGVGSATAKAVGGGAATPTEGTKTNEWWVEVSYDGKTRKPGLVEGDLVVQTDLPEYPELHIPVSATISSHGQ
jgi:hypothetical protein